MDWGDAMRQELIEKAVDLMIAQDSDGLGNIGPVMTEQERRYAIGVIEDKRDDALNALIGWGERWARVGKRRASRVMANR